MKKRLAYSTKMTLVFGSFITIFAITFNLLWFYGNKNYVEKDYMHNIENSAASAAKSFNLIIQSMQSTSYLIVSDPIVLDRLSKNQLSGEDYDSALKIQGILSNHLFLGNYVSDIQVLNNDGDYYSVDKNYTYSEGIKESAMVAFEAYIKEHEDQKLFYIDDRDKGLSDRLAYLRTIRDPENGAKLGYIKVDCDFKQIDKILRAVFQTEDDCYFITLDGTVIFSSGGKDAESLSGVGRYIHITKRLDYSDLSVSFYLSNTEITSQMFKMMLSNILLIIFVIVISFLFSFFASRLMTKNIRVLQQAMFLVAEGRLDRPVIIKSKDEFGALGNSFNNMIHYLNTLNKQVNKLELETKEASLRALQAQINPHFFFNTMECVNYFAALNQNEQIMKIVSALTNNFRYALKSEKGSSIGGEIEHTKGYVEILSYRYPDKINFHLEVDDALQDVILPKLTIQPLVENSVIHGILKKRGAGNVDLSIKQVDKCIVIRLFDDGVGIGATKLKELKDMMKQEIVETDTHIGIKNTYDRLKLMFGNRVDFNINSQEGAFTEIIIQIFNEV